ncbi:MAG: PIG-L family deacetylase [Proteobacteria bacterium]|nr:PIG-L family deacetylase [Pseudomonadota bacterium]MBI3496800.1 PIG-L family deacetylase [Pseudomonadota bacterium]
MTPEQRRILRQSRESPLLLLWQALLPLRSVVSFMMTGAHPDDETSALLARLAKGDGARVIYVSATRGGGGQNALGPESGEALALIRSHEMERAAAVLGMEVDWLEQGFGDRLSDFGFAKTPEATTAIWGEDRLLERLVEAIRRSRPDIVSPTFLDVPGQHGHHRAVTRATFKAFEAAADPARFPEQIEAGLRPWRIAKLYLPAYSGAGATYDDAEPPPPATLTVDVGGFDRWLGATYAEIGEWSRLCHRSQGMGRWRPEEDAPAIALNLAQTRLQRVNAEGSIFDGLPRRLGDLATGMKGAPSDALRQADRAIEAAIEAFPDFDRVAASVHEALGAIDHVLQTLGGLARTIAEDLEHRLGIKRRQLARASRLALSLVARLELPAMVVLGQPATGRLVLFQGGKPLTVRGSATSEAGTVEGPTAEGTLRYIPGSHAPFRQRFDPLAANAPIEGRLGYTVDGVDIEDAVAPEILPLEVPPLELTPAPEARVVVAGSQPRLEVRIGARNHTPAPIQTRLRLLGAEAVAPPLRLGPFEAAEISLTAATPAPGHASWQVVADGIAHGRVRRQHYPHIGTTGWIEPATLDLLVVDLALPPGVRIGYVEGGLDRVAGWLEEIGLQVERLSDDEILGGDLGRFETIVIGIKAFGRLPAAAPARLKDYVSRGGHLVSQYHRPGDGWDAAVTPPKRIAIGQPSLRWRVADPAAPIRILASGHPLLTYPNAIGPADWAGWQKERGLSFAASWDPAYVPLLAMADPGEAPLEGGLLSAPIGAGRHTHVSLALAHQLDRLVPGAFRLFANLVQPAGIGGGRLGGAAAALDRSSNP